MRARALLPAALAVAAAWPRPARATVAWTATMEAGNLSEWTSQTNGTKVLPDGGVRQNVEVVGDKVYTGKYALKITVHPDDDFGKYHQDRADTKHDSTLTGEGKDSYLSGYYFLPVDAQTRDEIAFYETKVTSTNWMDLWIEPKTGGGTTVKFGIESNGANLGSVLIWTGEWKAGVWHQFAIHVHWSTDATKGVVDLWFDGQPVLTGYKHKTKFDTNDMFFQTGLHRVLMQNFTESLTVDDFIEADTQAEIAIRAPNPAGGGATDAGTIDASGATDGAAGAGGATTVDAAGAGVTGAAGSGTTTGAAGATGAAGTAGAAGTTGAAGSTTTTGAAGSATAGAAGNSGAAGTSVTAHPAAKSGGCATAPAGSSPVGLFGALALLGLARRKRRQA